ncbi:winged helix-turn-helix domain-containing protein [Halovivax cerinus]|uniref:Helix-turn-helix domain-containing protein n=1 Tax=Halovivax cerinus TaxID=1487865 RepID=A0ABD5NSH6_9EURY|nr:winged helix-turn-helix domain-containing protein [Halovivax cerinus]
MSEEDRIEAVGAVLADPTARHILVETSQEPMTASTLSDRCAVSEPTVYRRLERLRECDLLVEQTRPDPEHGHHRTVYATDLDRLTVTLRDGTLALQVDRREDPSDRFTRLIEGM